MGFFGNVFAKFSMVWHVVTLDLNSPYVVLFYPQSRDHVFFSSSWSFPDPFVFFRVVDDFFVSRGCVSFFSSSGSFVSREFFPGVS